MPILAVSAIGIAGGARASALEEQRRIGREDGWAALALLSGVQTVPGRWGDLDVVLSDRVDPTGSDLALGFNGPMTTVDHGDYVPTPPGPPTVARPAVRGRAGSFRGEDRLELTPLGGALFHPGAVVGDFSIEFWLYPSLLTDGEIVLELQAVRLAGGASATRLPQLLQAIVADRRLTWRFVNFFHPPDGGRHRLEMSALTPLLPGRWHHHLLRFDATYGLLEYLVDGVPEATVYVTAGGSDGGTVYPPVIGRASRGRLIVGDGFTGVLDELMISPVFSPDPDLARYPAVAGTVVTEVIDLGAAGTRITAIDATATLPAATDIYLYYRVSDLPLRRGDPDGWTQIGLDQDLTGVRGRYLQIRADLLADGARNRSPVLSELRYVFEPRLPPPAPVGLRAGAANGAVELTWQPVPDRSVAGYLVYYGTRPGIYRSDDAGAGASPIDVGIRTAVAVDGLRNGQVYYFAVVSHDADDPRRQSAFSQEVYARPAAILASPSLPALSSAPSLPVQRPAARPGERAPEAGR